MESTSASAVPEQPPRTPTASIHSSNSDLDEKPLPTYSGLFEFTTKKDLIILLPGLFVSVASGLLVPAFTILLGKIFTAFGQFSTGDIAGGELENEIRPFVIGIVIVGAFAWALGWAHMSLWLAFGENTALRARERVIKGLLQKKISWYDLKTVDNGVSGTMNKAVKQIEDLQIACSAPMGAVLQLGVTFLVSFGIALKTSWSLTLVILASLPIIIVVVTLVAPRMQRNINLEKTHLSHAASHLIRAVTAIQTVKAFNAQAHEILRFDTILNLASTAYFRLAQINGFQQGLVRFVVLSMFVQGFWYGGSLVMKGNIEPGNVIMVFWAALMAVSSLQNISPQMIIVEKGKVASAELLLLCASRTDKKSEPMPPGARVGDIELKNVSFSYPGRPDRLVLDNVSLFLPSRDLTYIVGTSGSGKSTIGGLLTRLYNPTGGVITLGETDSLKLPAEWVRQQIHYLPQMSILFEETVGRNIALGRGDDWEQVSREQILTAAQKAMLQAVLFEDLPNGVDTLVGESGVAVSGGQRQRIALARAILRDPEILILDESTSALDYISRSLVNDAMRLIRQGKTTIIITHDVSMINDVDFTYVMKDGQVVQNGFKKDLMLLESGHFFQMSKALERIPQAPAEPISPAYSLPAASFSGVKLRQSDGLWMSSRATVFGEGVSITPRPLTMSDGDLMGATYMDEFWRVKEAAESVTTKRQNVGRAARLPVLNSVTESDYSIEKSSTTILESIQEKVGRSNSRKRREAKDLDNLSEKDIEAALEGKTVGSLTIWQMLRTSPKCLTPWQNALMFIGFTACVGNGAATPAFGFTLSQLMANLFNPNVSARITLYWALAVFGVAVFDGITTFLKIYLLETSAEKWVFRSRKEAIKRILKQDCEWFLRNDGQPAIVASRLINGGEEMRPILGRFAGNLINAGTMLFVGVVAALIVGWELTLVGLALTPIMFFSTKAYVAICEKFSRNVTKQVERSTMVLHEATKNIKVVVGLGLENYFENKFCREIVAARATATGKVFWIGTAFGILEGVGYFSKALIFWYGAHLVSEGRYSVLRMLTVFTLIIFSTTTAAQTMQLVPQISKSKEAANNVLALAALSKITDESIGDAKFPIQGEIALENVTFAYPGRPNHTVLRNVSLNIKAGETVAIVGASGSGKSTIANLVQRFYNPSNPHRGKITLDGADLKAIDTTFLRKNMAVVSQTPYLFDLTIRENITYGMPASCDVSDAQIEKAARLAGIHDFISSLIRGYDTPLGDCGSTLSGGQAQRIALARALVRHPQIIVLDECTSGLDPESSKAVQAAVSGLVKEGGRTTIIITHKENMIRVADRVVVMKNGEIVEVGTFEELSAQRGELWNILNSGEWDG